MEHKYKTFKNFIDKQMELKEQYLFDSGWEQIQSENNIVQYKLGRTILPFEVAFNYQFHHDTVCSKIEEPINGK